MKNKTIMELSKETPIFTVLSTEEKGKDVILLHTNVGFQLIGVDATTKGELNVFFNEVMAHSKGQVNELLDIIYSSAGASISYTEKKNPLSSFPAISKTNTTKLQAKGYKVLSEKTVLKALDEAKIKHDNFEYITLKLSNAHNSIDEKDKAYDAKIKSPTLFDWQKQLFSWLKSGAALNVALGGPAGTGKTELFKALANKAGVKYMVFQCDAGTEPGDLNSDFIPSTKIPGVFVLTLGALARAISEGYWVLIDEFNMAQPGATTCINSVTDKTGQITLKDHTVVTRHPDSRIFIAFNADYQNTYPRHEASRTRWISRTMWDITEEQFNDWISVYDFKNTKFLEVLYNVFRKAQTYYVNANLSTPMCFRSVDNFMSLLVSDMDDADMEVTEESMWSAFSATFLDIAYDDLSSQGLYEPVSNDFKVYAHDLYLAYLEGESIEDDSTTVTLSQELDLNDMGDFSSFGGVTMTEEGIPVEEEE